MRVLFVAMANSIHTARWISQLEDLEWDIHVFDTADSSISVDLRQVTLYRGWYWPPPKGLNVHYRWPFPHGNALIKRYCPPLARLIVPEMRKRLAILINRLHPDCIHVMNMQYSGYPFFGILPNVDQSIPWILSSWGSDLYYFQKQPEHQDRIRAVLKACPYYIPDCKRDIGLAAELGFEGKIPGVFPCGGGYDLQRMRSLSKPDAASRRRIILIKGYQHWVGRAITALDAIEQCQDALKGYEVIVYAAHPETKRKVEDMHLDLPIRVIPRIGSQELWELMGRSKISIGISTSDGTPNTLLEAMIMGAFPIQTDPGGASSEWITDGLNGLLVKPDDPDQIASAIRQAVTNDSLVDTAQEINAERTQSLDLNIIRPQVIELYRQVTGSQV